jgi:hypothetical protein
MSGLRSPSVRLPALELGKRRVPGVIWPLRIKFVTSIPSSVAEAVAKDFAAEHRSDPLPDRAVILF